MDSPTWGARQAAPVSEVGSEESEVAHAEEVRAAQLAKNEEEEEDATAAWLARMDVPTWGARAAAVSEVASEASEVARTEETRAAQLAEKEEEAKAAWLAR